MSTSLPESSWPPDDPRKPKFPYQTGFNTLIRRHVPPEPFGGCYDNPKGRNEQKRLDYRSDTQIDWCLRFPPSESSCTDMTEHDNATSTTHTMEFIDVLACGDGRGAQVALCRLDGNEQQCFVAKIYDPLYYENRDSFMDVRDVTYCADRDYACETLAYTKLRDEGVEGRFSPVYFGSWTFDMPVPAGEGPSAMATSRPVRMILLEWFQDGSMYSLLVSGRVHTIPITVRLDLMAQVMECWYQLFFYGVSHDDFAARNAVVAGLGDEEKRPPRAVAIDFNDSYVTDPEYYSSKFPRNPFPENPMHQFWNNPNEEFGAFIPKNYRKNKQAFNAWLQRRWGSKKGYAPPLPYDQMRYKFDVPLEYEPPLADVPADGKGESDRPQHDGI